jgi:recombination protein RecR
MMKGGLGNLMRQAQQMQETMQKAQAELATLEVTGESGAGMVKVTLNGRHEAKKVMDRAEAARRGQGHARGSGGRGHQRCGAKIAARSQEKYSGLMSGLNLPPGMKLPFSPANDEVHADSCPPDRFPALPARRRTEIRAAHGVLPAGARSRRRPVLSQALAEALSNVGHCKRCRMLTESEFCAICASTQRDVAQLCVVESPADVVAIEQSGGFRGRYFVLMGHLSPLDGVGPAELGMDEFERLLRGGEIREVILATNPTAEGEATAHYLGELALRSASRRRASRTACRWAANWNMSTAAHWRTPWRARTVVPRTAQLLVEANSADSSHSAAAQCAG